MSKTYVDKFINYMDAQPRELYYDGSPVGYVCVYPYKNGIEYIRPIKEILDDLGLTEDYGNKSQRAEYIALIQALLLTIPNQTYRLIGDCENIGKQMQGINKTRNPYMKTLKNLAEKIISQKNIKVEFLHMKRHNNLAGIELEQYLKENKLIGKKRTTR